MEITYNTAVEQLEELLADDFTLDEAAQAEALVDTCIGELTTIHDTDLYVPFGKSQSMGAVDDDTYTYTELGVDAYVGNRTEFDNLLAVEDDWNATAAEKRTSFENELREDEAHINSQGLDWWGAMTPSGFGPTEPTPFTDSDKVAVYEGDEVIVSVPAADVDELRVDAGHMPSTGHGGRVSSASTYIDWLSSARITAPDDDDAFTSEGMLQWEQLDDFDAVDKVDNMQAWWV